MLGVQVNILAFGFASAMVGGLANAQELVIPPQFEDAGIFYDGLAPVQLGGLWGLVNGQGALVYDPVFEVIRKGEDRRWGGRIDGKWRVFATDGTELATPALADFKPYRTGLAAVTSGDAWLMIDPVGWPRTPPIFLEVADWEDNIILARDEEGWAYFDLNEPHPVDRRIGIYEEVTGTPRISDRMIVLPLAEGYALLELGHQIETRPRMPLTGQRFIEPISEGMAAVQGPDGRWGYYHRNSEKVLWPNRFEGARAFSQGYAPVSLGGKWGYINRLGEVVVEPVYDDAYPFRNGYATMRQGDLRGFLRIGRDGLIEEYVAPQYQDVYRFVDGYAPVKISGLWGFLWDGGASLALMDTGLTEISP